MLAGPLVEFHQRYVFHKHIEQWQIQANQSIKDHKKLIYFALGKWSGSYSKDFTAIEGQDPGSLAHLFLSEKTMYGRCLFDLISPEFKPYLLLRGPPLS